MFALDFIAKLPSFKQFNGNVNRILGLKDPKEFHEILLVELPHDVDFVNERLLTLVLTVGRLLRKGLHCILLAVLMPNHQIN